jgi:hypothetical protein
MPWCFWCVGPIGGFGSAWPIPQITILPLPKTHLSRRYRPNKSHQSKRNRNTRPINKTTRAGMSPWSHQGPPYSTTNRCGLSFLAVVTRPWGTRPRPQDLQHSRANTDPHNSCNTQETRVKQNSLCFMQKDTLPSHASSGGHITPNSSQNRCGLCYLLMGII